MRQVLWAYFSLWCVLFALFFLAPHLAIAGAIGLISGNWRLWNKWTMGMLDI